MQHQGAANVFIPIQIPSGFLEFWPDAKLNQKVIENSYIEMGLHSSPEDMHKSSQKGANYHAFYSFSLTDWNWWRSISTVRAIEADKLESKTSLLKQLCTST